MGFNIEGTAELAVWKVNSKIHTMDAPSPPTEEPAAPEVPEVPEVG